MPVYMLTSEDHISRDHKGRLAEVVTDTHCTITGAPRDFVHVLFTEGYPVEGKLHIIGTVRAGRTKDMIKQMKHELCEKCSAILSHEMDQTTVVLSEIQAGWVMEGGHIMPEPGEEAVWLEKVRTVEAIHVNKQ